jgi:flavin reductase (DIM6/NTAB) family NADH-FMN oxidoreductase RutF
MAFKSVPYESLSFNPFTKIGKEWALLTAGTENSFNTMTVSWGGLGYIWNKPVATVYVRPQRYTKEFVDNSDTFTLSFFSEDYRKALSYCGTVSGKNVEDKWKDAGLHPYYVDRTTAVEEADLILVCKKLYAQDMLPECFVETECDTKWYPEKDYHTMYIAEIEKVLVRE